MKTYPFSNTTGGTIPAGAALVPSAGEDAGGRLVVSQPAADSSLFVLLNGPIDVPTGAFGVAFAPAPDVPVGIDPADSPYTAADTFGTQAGSWLLRKGKKGFRVVTPSVQGMANAVPDPLAAAGAGASWSTTVAGILTTTTQTGGGDKTSNDGTGGSRGAWYALTAEIAGDASLTAGWYPYFATIGINSSFFVHVRKWGSAAVPAPVNTPMFATTIGANTNSAAVPRLTFVSAAVTALALSPAILAAGDPGLTTQKMGFGVFRGAVLNRGIDRDFAAGDRPIVRGGIVVGYIDSGGTTHGDNAS